MKITVKDVARLEIGNLPAFTRPKFADTINFPVDLTQLRSDNLSELMGKYAALLAFVEQEATTWRIHELKVGQQMEDAKGEFLAENPKLLFLERWKLDARMGAAVKTQNLARRITTIRTLKERAESLVRTYDRLINVLSRELSRRLATNDGQRHSLR